jgi:hypothetical protein
MISTFLIAEMRWMLPHLPMREPIGTTQRGQVLLGLAGLTLGIGGAVGLEAKPIVFEPILRAVFFGLSFVLRTQLDYDPSQRGLFAIMLGLFGIFWALLFAYAFAREPARNRAIDNYLRRKNEIDTAQRVSYVSEDQRSA